MMPAKNEPYDRIADFIELMWETLRKDEARGMKPPIERRMLKSQYRKSRYCHPERIGPVKCVAAKIQRRVSLRQGDSSLASRRNEN